MIVGALFFNGPASSTYLPSVIRMEIRHPRKTIRLDYVIIIKVKFYLGIRVPELLKDLTSTSAATVLFGRFAWGGNFKFSHQKTNLFL